MRISLHGPSLFKRAGGTTEKLDSLFPTVKASTKDNKKLNIQVVGSSMQTACYFPIFWATDKIAAVSTLFLT